MFKNLLHSQVEEKKKAILRIKKLIQDKAGENVGLGEITNEVCTGLRTTLIHIFGVDRYSQVFAINF